jgi:hypothetical protein
MPSVTNSVEPSFGQLDSSVLNSISSGGAVAHSDRYVSQTARDSFASPSSSDNLSDIVNKSFSELNALNENRIREILDNQKENNAKIRALQDLKQKIRASGSTIDWSNSPENKALLDRCREYGLIAQEGKYRFDSAEKDSLLLNADSVQDRYSLSSEELKLKLSQMFNVKTQTIEMWVSLMQKIHEMAMSIIRNLRS